MWRIVMLAAGVFVVVILGFSLIGATGENEITANTILSAVDTDTSGFARAIEPRNWQFPRDHGPHPEFQTEWWYYTGNLATETGRRFGFQLTIFRRAIRPQTVSAGSEWRSNQIYFAHFTVSDIENAAFHHDERFSRGSAGLAGATLDPAYRVWLENWEVVGLNEDVTRLGIRARADEYAIDLTLEQIKPPALQGDNGLSPKSEEIGNASYYYSLSRLATSGSIVIRDQTYQVSGNTWMDHEFSTSALGDEAVGWDWFGLIFDNNHELMIGQIRQKDGTRQPAFGGLLIYPDGSARHLKASDFTITATEFWTSPHSGAIYPSGWEVTISTDDQSLKFTITPLARDQELANASITYWEGAVRVSGDVSGYGYAELTGYVDSMQGRF